MAMKASSPPPPPAPSCYPVDTGIRPTRLCKTPWVCRPFLRHHVETVEDRAKWGRHVRGVEAGHRTVPTRAGPAGVIAIRTVSPCAVEREAG